MIENEFKLMLTEKQYDDILSMFKWDNEITQTNYYYDTQELELSEQHITCRVREINGEYYLQMKLPADKLYSRVELEKQLSSLPQMLSGKELDSLCGRSGLSDVKMLGGLTTVRSVKKYNGAEIDLDRSTYFSKTDYELEIEFTDEHTARNLLTQIVEQLGLELDGDVCIGKARRFLTEYIKLFE